jgi:hypothetical protein
VPLLKARLEKIIGLRGGRCLVNNNLKFHKGSGPNTTDANLLICAFF